MREVAELLGFALVGAFLWFVWWPLVLLLAGVLLLVWANTRPSPAPAGVDERGEGP